MSALVCTSVCTSDAESNNVDVRNADPMIPLAATLRTLSPNDRERLAAILTSPETIREKLPSEENPSVLPNELRDSQGS
jgi:hypothetical protein